MGSGQMLSSIPFFLFLLLPTGTSSLPALPGLSPSQFSVWRDDHQLPRGLVSVTDFGADPTGKTDSTQVVQTALAASRTQNVSIFVPLGCYKISNVVNFTEPRNGSEKLPFWLSFFFGSGSFYIHSWRLRLLCVLYLADAGSPLLSWASVRYPLLPMASPSAPPSSFLQTPPVSPISSGPRPFLRSGPTGCRKMLFHTLARLLSPVCACFICFLSFARTCPYD